VTANISQATAQENRNFGAFPQETGGILPWINTKLFLRIACLNSILSIPLV